MTNIAVVLTKMPMWRFLDDSLGMLKALAGKSIFMTKSKDIRDSGCSIMNRNERQLIQILLRKKDGKDLGMAVFLRHRFRMKGKMTRHLSDVPLHVICSTSTGLLGAAHAPL